METGVESSQSPSAEPALCLQLLGPLAVLRRGRRLPLPASRKVRGLLAYLALTPRPLQRSHLCELLWESPDDPRGELRWCLSKIRSVIGATRVLTQGDSVQLDLEGCAVDARELASAIERGLAPLPQAQQQALAALCRGDFLEGLELARSPGFESWLTAQRRRFRSGHAALLEQLALALPDAEALDYLEQWIELAPFDRRAHEALLALLARQRRLREGEEHLSTALALFESEGLDGMPLREAWRLARLSPAADASVPQAAPAADPAPARRASIAVMPFADRSAAPSQRGGLADALAYDVTTRLAKLRSMFVIAQGSTFALHERRIGPEEAGRMLNVDYVLGGSVRQQDGQLMITAELIETRSARIVWSEILNQKPADAFSLLEQIGNRIVASIAAEIETLERNRAILRPPSSLNAWEAHHRGLWHMYRFNRADNERAHHFFETAVKLDPTFARAHAGLSFTHFQNVFLGWGDRATETRQAYDTAGQSLMADDRDPAAHWAMGRALWLRGSHDDAVLELERSVDLSPNFALAHYTLAFVRSQAGDPLAAIADSDCSRHLSPFDPLLFGMLGSRAMALARLERFEEAAEWSAKAASRPNAHAHIFAIAACCNALAGEIATARGFAAAARKTVPGYRFADFQNAFRFDADGAALFRKGARLAGIG